MTNQTGCDTTRLLSNGPSRLASRAHSRMETLPAVFAFGNALLSPTLTVTCRQTCMCSESDRLRLVNRYPDWTRRSGTGVHMLSVKQQVTVVTRSNQRPTTHNQSGHVQHRCNSQLRETPSAPTHQVGKCAVPVNASKCTYTLAPIRCFFSHSLSTLKLLTPLNRTFGMQAGYDKPPNTRWGRCHARIQPKAGCGSPAQYCPFRQFEAGEAPCKK